LRHEARAAAARMARSESPRVAEAGRAGLRERVLAAVRNEDYDGAWAIGDATCRATFAAAAEACQWSAHEMAAACLR